MSAEFDLIRDYFQQATGQRDDVMLGIGDDCALLQPSYDQQLAISMDTLVCGRHFVADVDPFSLGHKALAVNLSDMAAMGAEPAWATLSLTLPGADVHWQNWLQAFIAGFNALAQCYQVQLIGGDTTRGPLSITVQIHGLVPADQVMRRDAAQVGDLIYVSGTLGDAGLALQLQQAQSNTGADDLFARLNQPTPRIELGLALRSIANAAIDISDGLGADLSHICHASEVGAQLKSASIPLSDALRACMQEKINWPLVIGSGDDYELLFTVPPNKADLVQQAAEISKTPVSNIGVIWADRAIQMIMPDGSINSAINQGYDHFSKT